MSTSKSVDRPPACRPAVYYVKRFERTVWVSPTKTAPVATPWPADVLPRARMHVSALAHVAAAHYGEHLDNNAVEHAIRPVKLSAKSWLSVGHPGAGPGLANLFTLVDNVRQAGVDVERYLACLLTDLPSRSVRRLGEWLPTAWQQRDHRMGWAAATCRAAPSTRDRVVPTSWPVPGKTVTYGRVPAPGPCV